MRPPQFPDWLIRKDPGGCRRVMDGYLATVSLVRRLVADCSPWCCGCSWFLGAEKKRGCPGVKSLTAAEAPVCFRDERGVLVALPGFGGTAGNALTGALRTALRTGVAA